MAIPKRKRPAKAVTLDNVVEGFHELAAQALKDPDSLEGAHATTEGNPVNLGPRIPEAADMAEKMVDNAAANATRWLEKVLSPKKNPVEEAKKKKGKYNAAMQQVISEDRFAKGLDKVDIDEMYAIIRERGAAAFSSGVQARKGKITRVMGELRPLLLAVAQKLDAMPTDTDPQREAKLLAARKLMIEVGKIRRGGR